MKYPAVSIIIINFNGLADTRICLNSVLKTNYQHFNIIVIDNGSSKNELAILQGEFDDLRIIWKAFGQNLGFAGANNTIIREIKVPFVVLLNNDTEVDPNWLEPLITSALSDPKIAVCQGKIRSLYNKKFFDYAGAAGGFIDRLGYPYARGRIGFSLEEDIGQYDDEVDIFWASGAAFLLRRDIGVKYGLLPTEFFFYHEETDLCWRLKDAGYRIVFVPQSVIWHKGAGSSRRSKRELQKRIFYVHRNALLLAARNMTISSLAWVMPMRFFLDWLSVIYYALSGDMYFVWSVILAHLSFVKRLKSTLYYRRFQRNVPMDITEKELSPFSILWQYYIKGKKRYCEISGKSAASAIIPYQQTVTSNLSR